MKKKEQRIDALIVYGDKAFVKGKKIILSFFCLEAALMNRFIYLIIILD
jgi:hypothetical protein